MPSPLQDHVWHDGLDGMVMHYRVRPLREHHEHRHTELEFNLVVAGSGAYRCGDQRIDLGPGSAAWIFPGSDHRLVRTSPGFELWVVAFKASALRRHLGGVYRALSAKPAAQRWSRTLAAADTALLEGILRDLHRQDEPVRFNHGVRYLAALAWDAFQRAPDAPQGHPAVTAVAAALRARPGLDLDALARAAGVGRRRLAALVRADTGTGLAGLRNRCRVEQALSAARHGRDLTQAAKAAGFGSYRQFHRACRQVTGAAPGVARRRAPVAGRGRREQSGRPG